MYQYLISIVVAAAIVGSTLAWTQRNQPLPAQTPGETNGLLEALKSKDPNERAGALIELGSQTENLDQIVPAVLKSLLDLEPVVNAAASDAVVQLGPRICPYLRTYLESDDVRTYSLGCEAIRLVGEPCLDYMPLLRKKLAQGDPRFQRSSIGAMAGYGEKAIPALPEIIRALDSPNFHVQIEACRVIRAIGPKAKEAGPRLVQLARDGIPSARSHAMIALGAIGPQEGYDVVQVLDDQLTEYLLIHKQRALEGLALIGPEAQDALPNIERLMQDSSKSAQHYAAYAYWRITGDNRKSTALLVQLLDSIDFRDEAMKMLARMGPAAETAVPALIKQLDSPEIYSRESAILALEQIGSAAHPAIPRLDELARTSNDALIKKAAERAVQTIQQAETKSNQ